MPKRTRVNYSEVSPQLDDIHAKRIQTLGSTSTINQTDMRELANINIVEYVEDVPEVDITLDTMEVGNNESMGLLANKSFGCKVTAVGTDSTAGSDKIKIREGSYYVNGMRIEFEKSEVTIDSENAGKSVVVSLKPDPDADSLYEITPQESTEEEEVTSDHDNWIDLDNAKIVPDSEAVEDSSGNELDKDSDYEMDYEEGRIKFLGDGSADDEENCSINYDHTDIVPTDEVRIATIAVQDSDGDPLVEEPDITDDRDWKTVNVLDFEYAKVDIAAPVKFRNEDKVERTKYIEDAYVTNIEYSFEVDGQATENYSLSSDNKRWFFNASSNVVTDRYYSSDGGENSVSLSQNPGELANGKYMLKVLKNGEELEEGTDFEVTTGESPELNDLDELESGDTIMARYTASEGGTFPDNPIGENNPHPELAGGLNEGNIELYLSDDSEDKVLRVQTCSVSASLDRSELSQLGELKPYSRPLELPVEITTSIEVLDSDMNLFARLCGKDVDSVNEISLDDLLKDLDLTVEIYRENDTKREKLPENHPDKFPLKTVKVTNLAPTSEDWNIGVEEDVSQSFEFRSFNMDVTC